MVNKFSSDFTHTIVIIVKCNYHPNMAMFGSSKPRSKKIFYIPRDKIQLHIGVTLLEQEKCQEKCFELVDFTIENMFSSITSREL